ncbi:MAG: tetratricopeptide repeat protein [Crocinitomicaceae bacterium]|nr:tetratricopeptide repeat protein [Crocinitomicaceae bacterium]
MFVNKLHEEAHETLKNGDVEKAIEQYTQVLQEHPNHFDVLSDRGVAYLHANNQLGCYADLDRAIELQPNYSYRYACRAFAKNHFKDINGAVEDYEKAVQLDPDDAIANNNLGMLLEKQGYQQAAVDRFDRADKLSKAEDQLLDVIDELEENTPELKERVELPESKEPTVEEDQTTKSKEFKKLFTSKSQFKEFIAFMKNGFKIK